MKKSVAFLVLSLIIASVLLISSAKAQDSFRGIIPLITTQEEVEKKIGKPNEFGRYEFDEGRVYVNYRGNECSKSNLNCSCLIPLGTVISVSLEPYPDVRFEDLKLDLTLFEKKEVEGHVGGITAYINLKAGISYQVWEGTVTRIKYFESEETCKMLEQKASQKQDKQ